MSDESSSLYQRFVLERPLIALAFVALFTLGMAAGLPNFKLDASADSLTLDSDRDLDYFREVFKRYDTGDILVVTFTPDQDLYAEESLATLKSLRDDLAVVGGVASVLSILDVPLLYSPKLSLTALGGELSYLLDDTTDLTLARDEFSKNPIYQDTLVGPDGRTTAVLMNLEIDDTFLSLVRERDELLLRDKNGELSAEEKVQLEKVSADFLAYRTEAAKQSNAQVQEVRGIAAKYSDQATLFVGGAPMIANDMMQFIRDDLRTFCIAILVFIVVSLTAIFRQVKLIILPFLSCSVTAVVMLGFLSWVDWRLTVISSNFVALLLIITLAVSIHLLVAYRETVKKNPGRSSQELALATVRRMARPCLYTTLTTIVAFASLVFSNIRPVIDFGWMMTIGALVSLSLTFIIVPAGISLFGSEAKVNTSVEHRTYMQVFASIVERFPTGVLVSAGLIALVSIYGISELKAENRFIDYFKSDTEIHQGMLVIDRNLGGTMSLDIIIDAPQQHDEVEPLASVDAEAFGDDPFGDDPFADDSFGEDPFGDDPFGDDPFGDEIEGSSVQDNYWWNRNGIAKIERLHEFLQSQPEIGKVSSIATAAKLGRDLNGNKNLNDFELTIMRQRLGADLDGQLIRPYLSDELQQTRIATRVIESEPGLSRAELLQRIEHFAVNDLGFEASQIRTTGLIVLYNNMLQSLFGSQIQTLFAVFIGIMLMFMVLFRSVLVSIIAIVPNMLGAAIVLGFMGLASIPLDMMTITIAAIAVGMGVDHAIHYIHRFKTEFQTDGNYIATMHRSHQTIGRALFYTAITIVIGFSLLALSNFVPSIYFGLLTALAMLANTLLSLMLLPRLILMMKPFKKSAE